MNENDPAAYDYGEILGMPDSLVGALFEALKRGHEGQGEMLTEQELTVRRKALLDWANWLVTSFHTIALVRHGLINVTMDPKDAEPRLWPTFEDIELVDTEEISQAVNDLLEDLFPSEE
jgi:hypothetical protein